MTSAILLWLGSAMASPVTDLKKPAITHKDTTRNSIEDRGLKDLFESTPAGAEAGTAPINPLAWSFVQDYLARNGKRLESMKAWASPYFRMMDGILASYGIPGEMKYLAVIESDLHAYATSWAGAVGPWQFMPETGRLMGLRIDRYVDERTDYVKSTHAAAKYLRSLYGKYGDWLLVIAAYNGGPGRVESAIARSNSRDFWKLQYYLPEESRNHVKKFIGTHYIMEGSGGQTTSTKEEWVAAQARSYDALSSLQASLSDEEIANTTTAQITGRYNSVVICNQLAMDITQFNRLNPHFDKLVGADSGYTIRLPKEKMEQFNANRYSILYQSILATMHGGATSGNGFPDADRKRVTTKPGK